jgi:TonB family protein
MSVFAQSEDPILQVAEQMPMFPGCEDSTGTVQELKACADKKMLQFIYANVKYPEVDRLKGNEGTVVIKFIVEKDGTISDPQIVRDPGDQLGEEALRVVNLMNQLPKRWTPAKNQDKIVRTYFTLPIRFKIQEVEEPDFVINGRDSIWVRFNTPVVYTEGEEALQTYLEQNLRVPKEAQDSCRIGEIEMNILVYQDARVKILDLIDYSSLGIDYQFEAIRTINATYGQWTPATLDNRKVNTTRTVRVLFQPNYLTCGNAISDFTEANALVDEATVLIEQDSAYQEGISKLTEAINMFPENAEFLSIRGQAYLQLERKAEACADLLKTQDVIPGSWYNSLLPILCNGLEEEEDND